MRHLVGKLSMWLRSIRGSAVARVRVVDIQRQYPGLWVAVKGGEVVAAEETPYMLVMRLHEKGIEDASIFRCPAEHEPELVGLG